MSYFSNVWFYAKSLSERGKTTLAIIIIFIMIYAMMIYVTINIIS